MIRYDRNARGPVLLRNLFRLVSMIGLIWLSVIGTWFMIWLTYWSLA